MKISDQYQTFQKLLAADVCRLMKVKGIFGIFEFSGSTYAASHILHFITYIINHS